MPCADGRTAMPGALNPVLGWTSSSIDHLLLLLLLLLLHEAGVSQTHPRNNGTQSFQLYVQWREGIMALGEHRLVLPFLVPLVSLSSCKQIHHHLFGCRWKVTKCEPCDDGKERLVDVHVFPTKVAMRELKRITTKELKKIKHTRTRHAPHAQQTHQDIRQA